MHAPEKQVSPTLICYVIFFVLQDFAHDVLERRELFEIHLLKSRKETVLNVIKDTKRQMILHDILNDFETFVVPFINVSIKKSP